MASLQEIFMDQIFNPAHKFDARVIMDRSGGPSEYEPNEYRDGKKLSKQDQRFEVDMLMDSIKTARDDAETDTRAAQIAVMGRQDKDLRTRMTMKLGKRLGKLQPEYLIKSQEYEAMFGNLTDDDMIAMGMEEHMKTKKEVERLRSTIELMNQED